LYHIDVAPDLGQRDTGSERRTCLKVRLSPPGRVGARSFRSGFRPAPRHDPMAGPMAGRIPRQP